ncbi:MAG: TraR/DksA C4-type zinc finger protein [Kiritimatiellae bacterium]|nr:TraR/DksA C4-type zinc finger protein [Kiritimatiellia bacterium]MDD4735001.1 TraR/DksA C4-type zinc finger protein [Kiritimatiellia bacterium]
MNSKSAMDSFKKTLNEVHKRGMSKLSQSNRKMLKRDLQNLRDRVLGEIEFLTDDSLNRSMKDTAGDMTMHGMHMADHGTDNFNREFALNLVSAEHDILYEINDALRRIDDGTYGSCEDCNCQIEKARLEALPFARFCIKCKSAKEKGSVKYRPLGPTLSTRY